VSAHLKVDLRQVVAVAAVFESFAVPEVAVVVAVVVVVVVVVVIFFWYAYLFLSLLFPFCFVLWA
jgi:hypothetical protein